MSCLCKLLHGPCVSTDPRSASFPKASHHLLVTSRPLTLPCSMHCGERSGSCCLGITAGKHNVACFVRLDQRVLDEVETVGEETRRPAAEVDLVVADAKALPRQPIEEIPATSAREYQCSRSTLSPLPHYYGLLHTRECAGPVNGNLCTVFYCSACGPGLSLHLKFTRVAKRALR